jgi:hypothetical protein
MFAHRRHSGQDRLDMGCQDAVVGGFEGWHCARDDTRGLGVMRPSVATGASRGRAWCGTAERGGAHVAITSVTRPWASTPARVLTRRSQASHGRAAAGPKRHGHPARTLVRSRPRSECGQFQRRMRPRSKHCRALATLHYRSVTIRSGWRQVDSHAPSSGRPRPPSICQPGVTWRGSHRTDAAAFPLCPRGQGQTAQLSEIE